MIRRDQKIPVIWFVANVGGILGLCMGCSLVTIFEVLHHVILIFLRTGVKSVNRIHKTIRCVPRPAAAAGQSSGGDRPSGLTMAAFMQMGSNLNIVGGIPKMEPSAGILTPSKAALLIKNQHLAKTSQVQRTESQVAVRPNMSRRDSDLSRRGSF